MVLSLGRTIGKSQLTTSRHLDVSNTHSDVTYHSEVIYDYPDTVCLKPLYSPRSVTNFKHPQHIHNMFCIFTWVIVLICYVHYKIDIKYKFGIAHFK